MKIVPNFRVSLLGFTPPRPVVSPWFPHRLAIQRRRNEVLFIAAVCGPGPTADVAPPGATGGHKRRRESLGQGRLLPAHVYRSHISVLKIDGAGEPEGDGT